MIVADRPNACKMIPLMLILGDLALPTALKWHQIALLAGYWDSSTTHTRLDSAFAQLSSATYYRAQVGLGIHRSSRLEPNHPFQANSFNYVRFSSGQGRQGPAWQREDHPLPPSRRSNLLEYSPSQGQAGISRRSHSSQPGGSTHQ